MYDLATFQDYLNKIMTNSYKTKARIELLRREDESIKETIEGDIIKGSVNITNKNGVRRTCNITLDNSSGDYIPSEYNLWINDKFKLSIGILCNDGNYYYVKLGTYVMLNPSISSKEQTITMSGTDKYSLLNGKNGGNLDASYIIAAGTNVPTAIKTILSTYSDIKSPIIHSSFLSEVTPYTIAQAYGDSAADILGQLQGMLSSNVFYNVEGHYVYEPDIDDSLKGSQFDFNKNDFHYIDAKQEFMYEDVYNKVIVIGDNINGAIYDASASNENLQSPTRISLIGEKLYPPIEDSNIYTTALAQARANYELKRLTALYSTVSIQCAPIYHLDVDKVITLTDDKINLNKERFLIQSISIPLGKDATQMTVNVVKTSDLVL